MSDLGNVGNGFDFQINPYFFGGNPGQATSVPYPVEAQEILDGVVEGAFDVELLSLVEDFTSSSEALSGTMRDILLQLNMGPEEIDSITAVAQSGLLKRILVTYSYGPDELDGLPAVARSGTLKAILIVITMPTDSLDGIHAVALSGTLQ